MAGFPVPPEARLEALLREAFEFMPGPDMARLAEIEQRLLRAAQRPAAPRRAMLPWWAILLLAGGAATAAWWAGEILTEQNDAPDRYTIEPEASAGEAGAERRQDPASPLERKAEAASPPTDDQSRIIYERETP